MRNTVLVDAGAIVALLNRRDRHHAAIAALVENFEGTWLTTWAVIAVGVRVRKRAADAWELAARLLTLTPGATGPAPSAALRSG